MNVAFTVPGKPQGKQRARRGKGGRWYTPAATASYESNVGWCYLEERMKTGAAFLSGPVRVTVACYFPDARRRDADNVLKAVCDGLNGIAYADDSQVVAATVTKAIDRQRPRTEITVQSECVGKVEWPAVGAEK